eukprot:2491182-Pyramimonas_sp.AAC.1
MGDKAWDFLEAQPQARDYLAVCETHVGKAALHSWASKAWFSSMRLFAYPACPKARWDEAPGSGAGSQNEGG